MVNVLKETGVNVSVFSAHSTRSAASSKDSDKGLQFFTRKTLVKTLGRLY